MTMLLSILAASALTVSDFDQWLKDHPERTVIDVPSGTHETRGYWTGATAFKEGWVIRGEGMGNTVLRLTEVKDGANTVLRADRKQRVSISDLTIDCNGQAFGDATIKGLEFFQCGFVTVERVEILNAVGKRPLAAARESWGIWSDAQRTVIRDCVFRDFLGGSVTAFAKGGASMGSGEITGCMVDFEGLAMDGANQHFGLSAMNTTAFLISGNTVIGAVRGFNHDTSQGRNLLIQDNWFLGYYWGLFVGGGFQGRIVNNLFEPGRDRCAGIVFDSSADVPGARDWIARDNVFVNPGGFQAVTAFGNRNNSTMPGLFIEENRVDASFRSGGLGRDVARWSGNRSFPQNRSISEP